MNFICSGRTFSHRGLLYPSRLDVPHSPVKKPIPTDGDTSTKRLIFKPIPPNDRTTKDWTAIAWPTNIQSGTPDGKFGPAKMMEGWGNCWFLAALAAVANNPDGHKILAESIKQVDSGYEVTFKGAPNNTIFISDSELDKCINESGGDADTRLMELAANKLLNKKGNFKYMFIAAVMRGGMNQEEAEQCFQNSCSRQGIQDPITHNPMRGGAPAIMASFMFTDRYSDLLIATDAPMQRSDVMRFLKKHVTNTRDFISFVIYGKKNPLGNGHFAPYLVAHWDLIRTEITRDESLSEQQQTFLNALAKWLETRDQKNLMALMASAGNLNLEHCSLEEYVNTLAGNIFFMDEGNFNLLRTGVLEVLGGGPGYIGFPSGHAGTIEGINMAAGTFTYSEPKNPTIVHTGELYDLIEAIQFGKTYVNALELTTKRDDREPAEHAGKKKARHLRQIHNQVVRDGKIDQTESGPLANLMAIDDVVFRQIYDSDKNGVIEGSELKAVQLRVDQWIDHFEVTPIW